MYLPREGGRGRERELGMECNGECVRVRDQNMERKNERAETSSFVRWLGEED
jgi:hypothetical protein